MLISPLGTSLTRFDSAMLTAMDLGITGLCGIALQPMLGLMAFWYLQRAVYIAKGIEGVVGEIITKSFSFGAAAWVASRPEVYNTYVRDVFFTSIPAYLMQGVTAAATGTGAAVVSGVNTTAAAFDVMFAQMWQLASLTWGYAGTFDVGTKLGVIIMVLTALLGLGTMGIVYLCCRAVLSVVLVLGVAVLMFYPIESAKDMLPRWFGKIMSLTFMQVAIIIVLSTILTIDQDLMNQALATAPKPGGGALEQLAGIVPALAPVAAIVPGAVGQIQSLMSMVLVFFVGAFLILTLPAVAYSIGGGVAISLLPVLAAAFQALKGGASLAGGGLNALPAFPSMGGGSSTLSMGFPTGSLGGGGGGGASLPPPAPPALANTGPRMLR